MFKVKHLVLACSIACLAPTTYAAASSDTPIDGTLLVQRNCTPDDIYLNKESDPQFMKTKCTFLQADGDTSMQVTLHLAPDLNGAKGDCTFSSVNNYSHIYKVQGSKAAVAWHLIGSIHDLDEAPVLEGNHITFKVHNHKLKQYLEHDTYHANVLFYASKADNTDGFKDGDTLSCTFTPGLN